MQNLRSSFDLLFLFCALFLFRLCCVHHEKQPKMASIFTLLPGSHRVEPAASAAAASATPFVRAVTVSRTPEIEQYAFFLSLPPSLLFSSLLFTSLPFCLLFRKTLSDLPSRPSFFSELLDPIQSNSIHFISFPFLSLYFNPIRSGLVLGCPSWRRSSESWRRSVLTMSSSCVARQAVAKPLRSLSSSTKLASG